jgi:hypothetical protein
MPHPIPSAKTALKGILTARPAWAAVDIRDGQPTELEDISRDMFWFEPTEVPRDGWQWIGGNGRKIEFNLGFTIAILREGDDERDTEDLVWDLFDDLMQALKENPTLSDTVRQVEDVTGRQFNEPVPQHWQARFTGRINCQSRTY